MNEEPKPLRYLKGASKASKVGGERGTEAPLRYLKGASKASKVF